MDTVRHLAVIILIMGGVFFFGVGTLGLLRLPDALTRMHAAAKADTLGAGLVLLGVAVASDSIGLTLKLIVMIVFIWLTNPTATHIIARVAYRDKAFPPFLHGSVDVDNTEKGGLGQ